MFVIVDKSNSSIHREPNKRSYARTQYKSAGAAKAGITRTVTRLRHRLPKLLLMVRKSMRLQCTTHLEMLPIHT
jgi:hypothetical protein